MHAYRTHNCAALTESDVGQTVRLSGWIHRKRDHGQLVFIDLRDHFGLTQCVVDSSDASFALVEATRLESVVTITGTVLRRSDDTINTSLPTGHIEVRIEEFAVQSAADTLPLQVNSDEDSGRRNPFALSLSRFAPQSAASQHHVACANYSINPQPYGGAEFHRIPNPYFDRIIP